MTYLFMNYVSYVLQAVLNQFSKHISAADIDCLGRLRVLAQDGRLLVASEVFGMSSRKPGLETSIIPSNPWIIPKWNISITSNENSWPKIGRVWSLRGHPLNSPWRCVTSGKLAILTTNLSNLMAEQTWNYHKLYSYDFHFLAFLCSPAKIVQIPYVQRWSQLRWFHSPSICPNDSRLRMVQPAAKLKPHN